MNIFGKAIEDIDETDLLDLISNRVLENPHVEYKSQRPASDGEKNKFVKTVAAFANSAGGVLIYGIAEDKGVPTAIQPISGDIDGFKLQLQQLIRTRIEPPPASVVFQDVGTQNGSVLIVYVRRSWVRPHMCTQPNRFYIRADGGNREMGRDEVQTAFLGIEVNERKLRSFRDERAATALSGLGPYPTPTELPYFTIHIVSQDFFEDGRRQDVSALRKLADRGLWGRRGYGQWTRLNLDGTASSQSIIERGEHQGTGLHKGYSQVFRGGAVEFVTTDLFEYQSEQSGFGLYIPSTLLEEEAIQLTEASLGYMNEMGWRAPLMVALSMFSVRGYTMATSGAGFRSALSTTQLRIDRDDVLCTPQLVEDYGVNVVKVLHEPLNEIWQASGYAGSPNITPEHEWRP